MREEINDGSVSALWWPVSLYPDCPVLPDDSFALRSCRVQITSTRQVRRDNQVFWMALFDRHGPERVYLLGKNGGYVEDSKAAMTAQMDVNAGSPRELWRDNPMNLGPPPEPEAVPPHVVDQLPSSKASKMRHQKQKGEEAQDAQDRKDGERRLRDQIRHVFRDIPPERVADATARISASIKDAAVATKS
jgi:hypothetical protein